MNRLIAAATAVVLVLQPLAAFAGCSVFEHRDYQGAEWYLEDHERLVGASQDSATRLDVTTTYHEPSWNDVVSSFRVDAGCRIYMYEHIGVGGARWKSYDSYKYVGDDWNDVVSDVICYCD